MVPKQLTDLKLMVKRYQYKHAKSDRAKELIKLQAERIKRQLITPESGVV